VIVLHGVAQDECERLNHLVVEFLENVDGIDMDEEADYKVEKYRHRFPDWPWVQRRARCERALWEILLAAEDQYEHTLGALQALVLHNSIANWIELLKTDMAENQADSGDFQTIADLESLARAALPNAHILEVDRLAIDLLRGGDLAQRLQVDLRCLGELLPDDIRVAVETRLAAAGPNGREG